MASERTLSIVKPDAVKKNHIGGILAKLEAAGWRVESLTYMNMLLLPLAIAQRLRERVVGYNPQALSPSPRVNALLWRIWQLGRFWIPQRRLPVGLSLLAVARPGAG